MYRPFRPTAISGHTRLTSGHTRPTYGHKRVISGHKMAETYHAITSVEVWGEPCACIDLDTERREKERDASYI
jgi:hypothetical protein